MSHPPIVIVDEDDRPIGQATMDEAQLKGLYHRIVRVMIENDQGEILLQKRSPKQFLSPNLWDHTAAGHVDAGESYAHAASRELFEEMGLKPDLEFIAIYKSHKVKGKRIFNRFNGVYKGRISKDAKLGFESAEVADAKWRPLMWIKNDIKNNPDKYTSGLKHVINTFYK